MSSENQPSNINSKPKADAYTPWHTQLFRVLFILGLPFLFIFLIETILSVCGYGVNTDYIIKQKIDSEKRLLSNPLYTWKYFDPLMARPTIPFSLQTPKQTGTFRIVLLGGSAARGDPRPEFGLTRILELFLENRFPDARFEVINSAVVAINSHVVYDIAKSCVDQLEPDMFLVYMGNNEVVGPYGAGSVFTSYASNVHIPRTSSYCRSLSLGQLIRNIKNSRCKTGSISRTWQGLGMFLDHKVPANSPFLAAVYKNFARNIDDISRLCSNAGIPVIIGTVGVNLRDCPPFSSMHKDNISEELETEWQANYSKAIDFQKKNQPVKAVAFFRKAEEIDGNYAELHYRKALCFEELKDFDKAIEAFSTARDFDALRFRADTKINQIINNTLNRVSNNELYIADTEQAFSKASPNGIIGNRMFFEHVHLTFAGNYAAAEAFYREIIKHLPDRITKTAVNNPPLSMADCKKLLVLSDIEQCLISRSMLNRIDRVPFINQMNIDEQKQLYLEHSKELDNLVNEENIAAISRQYEDQLQRSLKKWGKADFHNLKNYGSFLMFFRFDNKKAEPYLRDALSQAPQSEQAILLFIENQLRQKKVSEAIATYEKGLEFYNKSPFYEFHVGTGFLKRKYASEAVRFFQNTIKLEPCLDSAHLMLVTAMLNQTYVSQLTREKAISHIKTALSINPKNQKARMLLDKLEKNRTY